MPALRKPHRLAILAPDLTVEGQDAVYEREAALLLWAALIECCQRHPGLAIYDAESTPLWPHDGHFSPAHAQLGATTTDPFWASTRRDELIWLELTLAAGKTSVVRLHTRSGTFDALGRRLGDQIDQVLSQWLLARDLGALPRRFEPITSDEVLAVVRVIAPTLVEQARAWTEPLEGAEGKRVARPVANRLPAVLKVPALRVLELALREDLGELILAIEPDHPQSRFAREPDQATLRRIIAAAPGWALPYGALGEGASELDIVAGAGIAALCRPGQLDVLEIAADHLADDGRIDEGLRLMERAQEIHDDDARAHIALLRLHAKTDRTGAWLAQAHRSARQHGCPMDPNLPWYPDQIQVDLLVADALMNAGRLDEAIALRANRLEGREESWPRHTEILARWRKDPRFVAWSYAREGHFRGDDARTVEGFGRIEPGDDVDLAVFIDSLVMMGREDEVPLAWAQFGLGRAFDGPRARLAAARGLMVAGEWRRGLEELWRVELVEPGRDEHVSIARCGLLMSTTPLDVAEAALAERIAIGAPTLARRMARDIADFMPAAGGSSLVARALSRGVAIEFDPAWLAGFAPTTCSKHAIDTLFAEAGGTGELLARGDRLVNRWLEVVFADAPEDDSAAIAEAAAYAAAQALARYLAMTTGSASVLAGALRTIAGEALALVRVHRHALRDREARAILGAIEPVLRRADRWVGTSWLATVERSCAIDERSGGDVGGFAPNCATVAARILGPEEAAVLSASIAHLHAERPAGWASAVSAQAQRLAMHTGSTGVDAWADAIIAELDAGESNTDEAIDTLHVTCYLAEGVTPGPSMRLARVLFRAGRAPAALAVLGAGLGAAEPAWRDRELAALAPDWKGDVPRELDKVAAAMYEALQKGDPLRAEKLGRFAVAYDPENGEAHRNLGLALAQQGKVADALHHLVRGTREQATQILSGVLYQAGKLPDAMAVLDYASRWYVRADQWLTYGGVAYAAMDNARTVRGYALAFQLDPEAFDGTQLNAYAGVLDEVGDYPTCEAIAKRLIALAGDDKTLLTSGWNHLACASIGLDRFDEAVELAERAVRDNPLPDNAAAFATTLERARTKAKTLALAPPPAKSREPIFALLESGDHATAAERLGDPSWRVRFAALGATRFRFGSEDRVEVTARARAAATRLLAETVGLVERDAVACRLLALQIREQAYFARDPVPSLGDRMTREAFYTEFRARGGVVLGEAAPPAVVFVDRVVVPGAKVARASDYVALLRELSERTPPEALAQFDLDEAGYIELAHAWAAAMEKDPSIATTIAAGLAARR